MAKFNKTKKFTFDEQDQTFDQIVEEEIREDGQVEEKSEAEEKERKEEPPKEKGETKESPKQVSEEREEEKADIMKEFYQPVLRRNRKENKSVKKVILIKPSLAGAIKRSAEEYHLSENEVINQLLERNYFPEEYK